MNQNLDCEIVFDLLPLYADNKCGRQTMRAVTDHLRECPKCREKLDALTDTSATSTIWKRAHTRVNRELRYFRWSLLAFAGLSTLLSMVVNYLTESRISWAWIVLGSTLCSYSSVFVYIHTETNRFIKAMLCFTVTLLLTLGLTQIVVYDIMGEGGVWIWSVALPVVSIYLAIIWMGIFISCHWKLNGFVGLAVIVLLFIPAQLAIDAIGVGYRLTPFAVNWVSMMIEGIIGLAFLALGILFDKKKAKHD